MGMRDSLGCADRVAPGRRTCFSQADRERAQDETRKSDRVKGISTMMWLKNRLSAFLMQARSRRDVPLSDIEQLSQNLKAADVVLVEGLTRVSDVIRWVTHSPWTHAALHIGRLDQIDDPALRAVVERHYQGPSNVPLLIESYLNEGTIVQPISFTRTITCELLGRET